MSSGYEFSPYQGLIGYTPKPLCDLLSLHYVPVYSNCNVLIRVLPVILFGSNAYLQVQNSRKEGKNVKSYKISSSSNTFYVSDCVYYKQLKCRNCQGHAYVVVHSNNKLFIKHGIKYVALHPCRVMLEKNSYMKKNKVFY